MNIEPINPRIISNKETEMSKSNDIPAKDKENPATLKPGKEITVTLQKDEDHTLEFINPNGAQVLCTIEAGEGEISLYKNGVRITELSRTYSMSTKPGYPLIVSLNTNLTSPQDDVERANTVIALDRDKLSVQYGVSKKKITEKYLRRKLGRGYGVPEASIEIRTLPKSNKKKLLIPDSIWEVYIVAVGAEENRFKVELIPKEK